MKATQLPNGDIRLRTDLTQEEYAELKLAIYDVTLDGLSCPLTDNGKEALHRITSLFRRCFVQDVERVVLAERQAVAAQ